ncbi:MULTISPECIES: sigma factor-like helix-turn-helix DNA-binding protein [Streptomyces]|uniref:Sigma factor-like helix-turn-helix DNA-binding protein n=1 Tax=Streptomyces mirabilis TaxID=68239 RepID=A0ABU3ULU8_9ACTN|nr:MULTISPECIES: sigma factor-like helix-turn-helix DNA-binding protein [Streptomyces]MCX5351622.1 RNA polymerase subunit sigma-70 [Streptomyces mirabilis]MDU8994900.1 sigma factor-like helix-turn-helix DNA-binding protein [Streptomyces mirabilis]
MRERRAFQNARRAREFEAFVAGAAGRLLHAATLLTAEPPNANPRARRLLTLALAHTYASWDRLRGEDPYDRARQQLAVRFARGAWHQYGALGRSRPAPSPSVSGSGSVPGSGSVAVLARLTPQERLVLVLRMYEGVAEEQTAALLGLPVERVRAICARAMTTLLHPPRGPAPTMAKVVPS